MRCYAVKTDQIMKATHKSITEILVVATMLIGMPCVGQTTVPIPVDYRTASSIDGRLFESVISKADIARTGPEERRGDATPAGIGLLSAGQKALDAFNALGMPNSKDWVLHSVTRKHYVGTGWVYAAAFTKLSEKQPDYMENQLEITVLLDGSVTPVRIKEPAQKVGIKVPSK